MRKRLRTPALVALALALVFSMLPTASFGQGKQLPEGAGQNHASQTPEGELLASGDTAEANADTAGADASTTPNTDGGGTDVSPAPGDTPEGEDTAASAADALQGEGALQPMAIIPQDEGALQPMADTSDFIVDGDGLDDTDYSFAGDVLTILSATPMTIRMVTPGATTTNRIVVNDGVAANITLDGVKIDVRAIDGATPFRVNDDATLNLTLLGASTLQAGSIASGLKAEAGSTLTITAASTGKLTAVAKDDSSNTTTTTAGISGNAINIAGGEVEARGAGRAPGGNAGAGICGSTINISGGTVDARGNWGGAGINVAEGASIHISGGTVTAHGGNDTGAAGIGANYPQRTGSITITGGTVTAIGGAGTNTGGGGAGIGGVKESGGGSITITGGTVTAIGGDGGDGGGAGIGGGYNARFGTITISGGRIMATGGNDAASIGLGATGANPTATTVTISGGTISGAAGAAATIRARSSAGVTGASVTITGGSVHATSVVPAPQNAVGSGDPVFLNTLTASAAQGVAVSAGAIDGVACNETADADTGVYGIRDVKTDAGGTLYLWLTENETASAQVQLTVGGTGYAAAYPRPETGSAPATLLLSVTQVDILGITPPATGQTPVTSITETDQYTGTVSWSPALDSNGHFKPTIAYTATITLTAKTGYTFAGVDEDFFIVAGAASVHNDANTGTVIAAFPATATAVVNLSAIPGITPPATGQTPVTSITETDQYTGSVTWSPALDSNGHFKPAIAYTATITLIAKAGYTFTGVPANFFTVAGATATNTAGTVTVTAAFPATALIPISIAAIGGIMPPATGVQPVPASGGSITETDQYTGTVSWSPELDSNGHFKPAIAYTATITLATKPGYTFAGVGEDFFTVAGAASVSFTTNTANTGTVTAVFPATATAVVNLSAIPGVTVPVTGQTPVTSITATDEYTGTVSWSHELDSNGHFKPAIAYTATITLTAKTGYTFAGVDEDFFTVAGAASVHNDANTGTVTAEFPATATAVVNLSAIPGVTVPATGQTPVTSITETDQYTGSVTWSPALQDGHFKPGIAYAAAITLTAKTGYTFAGVGEDFFTVAGAASVSFTTNTANTGTVTAVFPATATAVVNLSAIPGVTVPVTGQTPVTSITETNQYTGSVTWSHELDSNSHFKPGIAYTATITLTAKPGYTFTGVGEDFFTVAGAATVHNDANTGTATAAFPATALIPISEAAIEGITAPVTGAQPSPASGGSITETAQYTGTVSWSPERASDGSFKPDTAYTATITLTAKTGYTFTGVGADFFSVAGAAATNTAGSGVVTAVFPETGAAPPPPPDKSALTAVLDAARALEHTFQTEASWAALQAAIAVGQSIADGPGATQTQIDAATAAINTALLAIRYDYPVLDVFVAWQGTGEAKTRINADEHKFRYLALDGHLVPESAYTIASGSTIITLHEAYLKTLAPGSYDFYAEFTDGTAGPLTLTVKASDDDDDTSGDGTSGGGGGGETSGGETSGGGGAGGSSGSGGSGTSIPATGDSATLPIALAFVFLTAASVLLVIRSTRLRRHRS